MSSANLKKAVKRREARNVQEYRKARIVSLERECRNDGKTEHLILIRMTGRKNRALQVPPVVPYKALGKFYYDLLCGKKIKPW